MSCNGNPARRLILSVLKAQLEALAGPDDVNMDAPKGLRARAERLADRRALDERIEQLEVANLFSYDLQAQRLRPAPLRAIVAEKGCGKRRGSSTSILSR